MIRYTTIYIVLLLLASLTSCDTRRKLSENPNISGKTSVTIRLDWKNLKTGDTPFDKMELHLYDERGNHIIKQADQNGYTGELPEGGYSLLVFNPDADNVLYEALNSYAEAEIRTPSAQETRATKGEELMHPGSVYGSSVDKFIVKAGTPTEVKALLNPYVSVLRVKIELTGEVSRVVGCKIKITGIADRINHATGRVLSTHDEFIVLSPDIMSTDFATSVSILGVNGNIQNIMEVILTLDNGETMVVEENITAEIKDVNTSLSPNINIKPVIDLNNKMGKLTATIISWKVTGGNANVEE